jgi:cell division protein FtsL
MPATAPQIRPPASARPLEVAVDDAPRHLRVVDEPARSLRTLPTFVLSVSLAFAIAFAVVACQVLLVQGQERLDTLHADIGEQDGRHQELRLEVAELESPARIVAAATELGMVTPPEVLYLTPAPNEQGRLQERSGETDTSGGEQG